jgi:hypothetical protein
MGLIKSDKTAQLDGLTQLAEETLQAYRDLLAEVADGSLRTALGNQLAEAQRRFDALIEYRRERDELPQAGDPERGHLRALLAEIRAAVVPGDSSEHVADSLLAMTASLRALLTQTLSCDLAAKESRLLEALQATLQDLDGLLRARRTR